MIVDLHTALSTRLNELERLATEASEGPWTLAEQQDGRAIESGEHTVAETYDCGEHHDRWLPDALFIAAMDPSSVLRWVAGEREVLDRHRPHPADPAICWGCSRLAEDALPGLCPEIASCATRLGVDVTNEGNGS